MGPLSITLGFAVVLGRGLLTALTFGFGAVLVLDLVIFFF